jgi:hypothetical protein
MSREAPDSSRGASLRVYGTPTSKVARFRVVSLAVLITGRGAPSIYLSLKMPVQVQAAFLPECPPRNSTGETRMFSSLLAYSTSSVRSRTFTLCIRLRWRNSTVSTFNLRLNAISFGDELSPSNFSITRSRLLNPS